MYRREDWRETNRMRAGDNGKGKERRKAPLLHFPSSHRPPRAFYFYITAIFIGIPRGSLCRGESDRAQRSVQFLYW